MKCKYRDSNGNTVKTTVEWRIFYPKCPKINVNCNAIAGAYLPAITVCYMRLFI